jgi:hypothetical protein
MRGKRGMGKNVFNIAALILLVFFSANYAQKTGLNGRVIDKDSKPIQGSLVKLIIAKKSLNTDTDGKFFIEMPSAHVLQPDQVINTISIYNGYLSFSVSENQQKAYIEVYCKYFSGLLTHRDVYPEIAHWKYVKRFKNPEP